MNSDWLKNQAIAIDSFAHGYKKCLEDIQAQLVKEGTPAPKADDPAPGNPTA